MSRELTKDDLHRMKLEQVASGAKAHWSEAQDELLLDLYSEGHSFTRIGALMNRSRNAVAGRLRRLGVGRGNGPLKGLKRKDFIAEHVANGGTIGVAAERLRISHNLADRLWAEIVRECGHQAI